MGLLFFTSLLFRLPMAAHLCVQSACVALLMLFGVHTHCQSQVRMMYDRSQESKA